VEDWAEIRRLHRAERLPIKQIVSRLGVSRNTVRRALRSDDPPSSVRPRRGSLVDAVEPRVRLLLREFPRMPATVIAERIEWPHSLTILKDRIREIRPEYVGVDPADRTVYRPGEITQCDLWFPGVPIPVGHGRIETMLPVLVMTHTYSRFMSAIMLPSRQGGDLTAGMWSLIQQVGRVSKTLLWDRESAIGGRGKVSLVAATFAGTLATRFDLAPARDPEFKGMVERNNGYLETSFLPGRRFVSPQDFTLQLQTWLTERANQRRVRAIQGRPAELLAVDYERMVPLPPNDPIVGLTNRIRLGRDYYVRLDGNDYSVDPSVIGRFVDVTASLDEVIVRCDRQIVAAHERCWANEQVLRDPAHLERAQQLRHELNEKRRDQERSVRRHTDGTPVPIRALSEYDALFGVHFTTTGKKKEAQ
jgi:transposase